MELRILRYAYRKIGVPPRYMFVVMLLSLLGSHVNIPLHAMRVERLAQPQDVTVFGRTYIAPPMVAHGTTFVAINLGGALLPLILSLYLFLSSRLRGGACWSESRSSPGSSTVSPGSCPVSASRCRCSFRR